ncbi:pyridoxamine 5'-phosphate oxidase family protein [Streptomyces canus]|uniref:pyridoxamine 5'-phosphate oxidase family protein n=1 Tax=Streptomyces canus TaxID=58343 RepID=UPI0009A0F6C5|nr:pyridoxamine 5'-phosphate oxidase family protein [Streptomyces canus]
MGNCVHGSHLHTTTSRSIRTVAAGRRLPPTLFLQTSWTGASGSGRRRPARPRRRRHAHPGDRRPTRPEFDVESFLSQPLTARLATHGPTMRPVWFLWEEGAFWVLTGPWAKLFDHVRSNPRVALVVDASSSVSRSRPVRRPGERGTTWLRLVPDSLSEVGVVTRQPW